MECPYCGKELEIIDYYGKMQYSEHYWIYPHSWIEKEGEIFQCNYVDGFEDKETAIEYAKSNDIKYESWEEIICNSAVFNGYFYTDSSGNLCEGYPC